MKKEQACLIVTIPCFLIFPLAILLGAGETAAQPVLSVGRNAPEVEGSDADTPQNSSFSDIHQLEEVVVTATRRTETIMDVPFSVNVQEESDIRRLNTFNLETLSRNIAGLNIQNLGPGQSVVNIRGISSGQIVRDQPGVKEQVGVYLDDVPIAISLFTPDLDLYDVRRVETLRGPQGTLFGSGSIGGTVRYVTNKPQIGVKDVRTQFDLNTIDSGSSGGHVKAAFNAPLGDNAAVRVVGYGTRYGGFIDALQVTGEKDDNVNDGGRFGGRVSVLWQPTANVTIAPKLVYQSIDVDGFNRDEIFNLFANPYSTTRPRVQLGKRQQFLLRDEAFEDETMLLDNTIKWNPNDRIEATYVASYTKRDLLVSRDASALAGSVAVDIGFPPEGVLIPSNLRDTTELEQMTHEVRIASTDDSPFQWQAGVFYSNIKRDYAQRLPTPGWDRTHTNAGSPLGASEDSSNGFNTMDSPYVSDLTYDLSQIAVFGEATYTLFDRLDLTAGLRWYDWEEDKTFKSGGAFSNTAAQNQNVTVSSDGFTPRFMVKYDVTDRVAVNAQASRGFRLGGVNDPLNAPLCGADYDTYRGYQRFKDETLWNYEVGLKSSYDKVTLNASLFYADIDNLGVNVDAGECSSRVTVSVPEAHSMGGELEFAVHPTDALLVTFAGSYVEAEFDSTVPNVPGIKDGNRIPSVPNWQLSAVATYTFPGLFQSKESYVTASWQYVGNQFTQPGDQESTSYPSRLITGLTGADMASDNFRDQMELDAYHLLNLNTGLLYDTWEVMLYIKNVSDENPQLSFDRERNGAARMAYRVGQPRTFGILTRFYF
ncbi:MAG: TonB-dependent receptor [Nitrospira sp. SB0667_bin_9]|nr:TonB-dependent receptor [Nitrospira sp. SB0667_bin_9]MYD31780.1 TonB-dependent receptor [Nitrospira sp. SB0661_bin_20]MYJ22565.1 TonB-dependent receptor [Nitrospira sp. SB0673_bin_12]